MTTAELNIENLRYPVGKFAAPNSVSEQDMESWIQIIEQFPAELKKVTRDMNDTQLDTTYREGGWTARQVIHHLADSHMNAYIRFKLALTEDNPTIKPYFEDRLAELKDGKSAPVDVSIAILETLHKRWVMMLRNMSSSDFKRTFFHPEKKSNQSLETTLALYAWHCRHHLGHVNLVKEKA